jgi:hypothetical protein
VPNPNVPDHDPVASGSGAHYRSIAPAPIPIPDSADVPDVMRERYDLDDPYELGRRDGAANALHRVERALRWCTAAEVRATLQPLRQTPDHLDAVLRSLDDLADDAVQRKAGER